ncbi:MAG: UvrABC system protein C [Alphaproteobacteria bacterium ADurb.BinA280]|nr:MAG: UvrABC system protein C [Alphaproteobacteria bacterium ADurb.BinA280]
MQQLQDYLGLVEAPLRIECIDISGHQGTNLTASIVVFEDAAAAKSEYRKYAIADLQDDLASMREAVTRRFSRLAPGGSGDDEVTRRRYRPGLLVVDGGEPQVNAAADALAELGIDFIAVCGLAKRLEEVWLPGDRDPVILPRRSEGLYLLQRVRDEAHRFAIVGHRARRAKARGRSTLEDIAGIGPARRKNLLAQFGGLDGVRAATIEDLCRVTGISRHLAEAIVTQLRS